MATRRSGEQAGAEANAAERETFRTAMHDVKPLKSAPRVPAPRSRLRKRRPPHPSDASEARTADMPLIEAEQAAQHSDAVLSFQRAGVRTQVMRRLRRGLYPSDDALDLHGLTQAAARERLAEFIQSSRDAGMRCVRIVHGKGFRSGTRGPVLKVAVDLWLRRHLDVMAFSSAKPIDGGTGALYVLLRA